MNMSGMSGASFSHVQVVTALAFVLVLAGCGGGEERGSNAEEGVSKQEFIRTSDAICAEANEKRDAYYEQHPEIYGSNFVEPGFPRAIAKYVTTIEPVYADALTKLKGLEAPREDEDTITAMRAKFDEAFARIDDMVAAARARDRDRMQRSWGAWTQTAIAGQNIAFKYGSKECARFGNP